MKYTQFPYLLPPVAQGPDEGVLSGLNEKRAEGSTEVEQIETRGDGREAAPTFASPPFTACDGCCECEDVRCRTPSGPSRDFRDPRRQRVAAALPSRSSERVVG